MTCFSLFFEFFQAGLFSTGGGMATLPFVLRIMERHPDWFTGITLPDMVAIAESTPGPIGINVSTYAGYIAAGPAGAFCATFGLVLPSFLCILLVASFLNRFRSSRIVNDAFEGIRPVTAGLIAAACWSLLSIAMFPGLGAGPLIRAVEWKPLVLFIAMFTLMQWKKTAKIHPFFYILAGAAAGLLFSF